jgi:predicted TIM-barrel fold metal-dependent hydrolase
LIRAYNDWLIDFCSYAPDRLLGVGELPCWDMDLMLDEVKKIQVGGLKAVQLPIAPGYVGDWSAPADHNYTDPWWEPLWNTLEELRLPIVAHVEALTATPGMNGYLNGVASAVNMWTNKSVPGEMVSSLILGGAFERHPNLKLVLNETGAGWLAPLIAWAELCFDQSHRQKVYQPLRLSRRPKEYINDQVIASFLWDSCAVQYRDMIGTESLAWCSDYPENYGTFGSTKVQIDHDLAGCTDDERTAILAGNAVRTFGL